MKHNKKIEITTTWECINLQEIGTEPDKTTIINHKIILDEKAKDHIIKHFENNNDVIGVYRFKSTTLNKYVYVGGFEVEIK